MRTTLQVILFSVGGVVLGAGIFGVWLAASFYLFSIIFDGLSLVEAVLGSFFHADRPVYAGLFTGGLAGIIPGLVTAIVVWYFEISTFQKGALAGCYVIVGLFLIFFMTESTEFRDIDGALLFLKLLLIFLVPAVLTGLVFTAISRRIGI